MNEKKEAPVAMWLAQPLEHDVQAALDRLRRAEDVQRIAVMPDVHLAIDVCIGMVIGTRRLVFPAAVGRDIGCGMYAVALDAGAKLLAGGEAAARLLRGLYEAVPAQRRHRTRAWPTPQALRERKLSHPALDAIARDEGTLQLGTLGGGNHFIEFQADEEQRLWLMIHSGSRAMGQAIREHHLAGAMKVGGSLRALDTDAGAGKAYLADLEWARCYAQENRRAMAQAVAELIKRLFNVDALERSIIECDHNHVSRETIDGQAFWVHRKGAMPAAGGLAGVLPGSMGSPSFHVEGRGCEKAMNSSAHGAGRAMSREAARKRISARELHRQMEGVWFDYRLAGRLRDEAPVAYKDIHAVLRAGRDLIKVTRALRPVLTYKGPGG